MNQFLAEYVVWFTTLFSHTAGQVVSDRDTTALTFGQSHHHSLCMCVQMGKALNHSGFWVYKVWPERKKGLHSPKLMTEHLRLWDVWRNFPFQLLQNYKLPFQVLKYWVWDRSELVSVCFCYSCIIIGFAWWKTMTCITIIVTSAKPVFRHSTPITTL